MKNSQDETQERLPELIHTIQRCVLSERTGAAAVPIYYDRKTIMVAIKTTGWDVLGEIAERMSKMIQAAGLYGRLEAEGYGLAFRPL